MLVALAAPVLAASSQLAAAQIAANPVAAAPVAACVAEDGCVTTGAAQLFALADKLFAAGDAAGAANILVALTQDKHSELRSEARFRLAAVREKMGDLAGAAKALRDLLAEQPGANPARLELARILSLMGEAKSAQAELAAAERAGLPAEVEQTVRRFSNSLAPPRRRGISLEFASGPDSNVNRATGSQYLDTIIAPFVLDADARRRSGVGFSASGQAWMRNGVGAIKWLSQASLRADLFDKARFNDIQAGIDSGPQFNGRLGLIRPALLVERRWYGGRGYASGWGASLGWQVLLGDKIQAGFGAARVRQRVDRNRFQDGWRSNVNLTLSRALGKSTTARATVRWGALDAKVKPESLRQWGGDMLIANRFAGFTAFVEAGYTHTRGLAPLFLFGKERRDRRIDLSAGIILSKLRLGGFSPLLRITHTDSKAAIQLYDYQRTRLDIGFTQSF